MYQIKIIIYSLSIVTLGYSGTIGCMDDGYQQWSPNFGSPACNYNPNALIQDTCYYSDCHGCFPEECGELNNSECTYIGDQGVFKCSIGYMLYTTEQECIVQEGVWYKDGTDICGLCGGDGGTCTDCNGTPNGSAYYDACGGCVGGVSVGDETYFDCLSIIIESSSILSNSSDILSVFASNMDMLQSLDITFDYDVNFIEIIDFELYNTDLENYDYAIAFDTAELTSDLARTTLTMYFEPDNNGAIFFTDEKKHILDININVLDIEINTSTQIKIHTLTVNENQMDISNWEDGTLTVCPDEGYVDGCGNCVYGPNIDCLSAEFQIFDMNYEINDNSIPLIKDSIFVSLYINNLPDLLEGIDIELEFDPDIISLKQWSINSNELDDDLLIPGILDSSYNWEAGINDSTFSASIYLSDDLIDISLIENTGNVLFLKFVLTNIGDSTLIGTNTIISYTNILINEHPMQESNYTSQTFEIDDILSVVNNIPLPKKYYLSQNYPNPFNPTTSIEYIVSYYDYITINIINSRGQIINTIVQKPHQPGNYVIIWDGTNHHGNPVPTGVYFYKMVGSDFMSVRKLVLLK